VIESLVQANQLPDQVYHLASLLSIICLRSYSMLRYSVTTIACSCLSVALYLLVHPDWVRSKAFLTVLGNEYIDCVAQVFFLHNSFCMNPVQCIFGMYDTPDKCNVSRIVPTIDTIVVQGFNTIHGKDSTSIDRLSDVDFLFAH
jgi:hypothetical protein